MSDTIDPHVDDDFDDFDDDFDSPAGEEPAPPRAASTVATQVRSQHGQATSASGVIVDDGVQFGVDPDFTQSVQARPGAMFDMPSVDDVLKVPRTRSGGKGGRQRGAVGHDDEPDTGDADIVDDSAEVASPKSSRAERKASDREERRARRAQRLADAAARKEARKRERPPRVAEAAEGGPVPARPSHTKRRVVAAAAVVAVVVGAVATFILLRPGTPAPQPTQVASSASTPSGASFAAGDACVPGPAAQGATVLDATSSRDRSSPIGAISALEHAYYVDRSGEAVAALWPQRSTAANPASIQQGLDQHFPAGVAATYCVQVTPTADPNTYTVQTIESRDDVEFQRGKQEITLRNTGGLYEVVGLRNISG